MSSRFILPFADVGSGITPSSGAKLFFFADDGVTPKDTFSDQLSTPTPNANPVIADATGVFGDIYIAGSYKVTLQDKNGSQQFGGVIVEEFATGNFDTNLINDLSQAYEFATRQDMIDSVIVFPEGKTLHVKDTLANFKVTSGATPRPLSSPTLAGFGYGELLYIDSIDIVQAGGDPTAVVDVMPLLDELKTLGVKITQSGGSFLFGSGFTLVDGFDIEFTDGAEFVRKTDVRIRAGDASNRTLLVATGTWALGKRTITLDAASYALANVGDTLYIRNKASDNPDYILDFVATPNDLNDWVYQVQTPVIQSKDGGNVITVRQAAKMPYDFDTTALIDRLDELVRNVKIKCNFRNDVGSPLASAEAAFIATGAMYGLDISGSKFFMNNESPGVYVTVGRVKSIRGCEFHDGRNLDVFLRQDCPNSKLNNASFFNHRTNDASIFIEAHNFNIDISSNSFDTAQWDDTTSVISAIQLDAKVNNCTINGNTVFSYPIGVRAELGCFGNSISGNTFQLCEISGVRTVGTRSNVISSNAFLDCGLSTTANATLSQQQGAIYVNGIFDTTIHDNTMAWVNPAFTGNFFAALSGSMNNSSFQGNTISQSQRAVWLIGGDENDISNNPKLEAIGNVNAVVIDGSATSYNKVNSNIIVGNNASAVGVVISGGSEGNEVQRNTMMNCTWAVQVLASTNYQSIRDNSGDFARTINADIIAPVMPINATARRDFTIYELRFDQLSASGGVYWQYKQNIGLDRWIAFTAATSVVDI